MNVRDKQDGQEILVVPGVRFTLLQSGERIMLAFVEIPEGGTVPTHSHPHEQMGICLKGSAEFETNDGVKTVREGQVYYIPGGEKHGVKNPSKGGAVFLDIFSPPREDYLAKIRA